MLLTIPNILPTQQDIGVVIRRQTQVVVSFQYQVDRLDSQLYQLVLVVATKAYQTMRRRYRKGLCAVPIGLKIPVRLAQLRANMVYRTQERK
jgi:hypothetical protein